MKIIPLASDSLGVRSMATLVLLKKENFLIDPSAALGPYRYGLPPSKQEKEMLELSLKRIQKFSTLAKNIIITHYHFDHIPHYSKKEYIKKVFTKKQVFLKDYKTMHLSGKQRGSLFENAIKEVVSNYEFVDGKRIENDYLIEFSEAVWHGDIGSKVGKVIMVYFEEKNDSFLFGSDAQNLADPKAKEWFIQKNPKIGLIDGYPTIFIGWRFSSKNFEKSKENIKEIIQKTQLKKLIIEHHLLRDINYKEKISDILKLAEEVGVKVLTSAEFLGLENFFLEAWRKMLHENKIKVNVFEKDKEIIRKIEERLKDV